MKISDKMINELLNAKRVAVLTGAGISAESGVPTFRGEGGIWKKFRPEELANFSAFMKNTEMVWEWYDMRKKVVQKINPNNGHYALVDLENIYNDGFTLTTQNIDNLHKRSGSKRVLELHGNIERSYCIDCNKFYKEINLTEEYKIPKCECGGLIRPDVVWFGENLPEEEFQSSVEASENCDVYFSIGTSGNVYPAASLPSIAKSRGAYTVEINIEPSLISSEFDEIIIGKSGEILPEIVKQLKLKMK